MGASDFCKFCKDINILSLLITQSNDIGDLSALYNCELTRILDKHAPLKSKLVTDRNGCKWFTDKLGDLKHQKRKLERKHNTSKLTGDLEIYRDACTTYETQKNLAKCNYYTNHVTGCLNDHCSLFTIINNFPHKSSASPLPDHDSPSSLAQDFANFFDSKIKKIYKQFNSINDTDQYTFPESENQSLLYSFTTITEDDILKTPIKSCPLDPLPAAIYKKVYIPLSLYL